MNHNNKSLHYKLLLTLSALGVVYGDIGTSPLYALREAFSGPHSIPLSPDNVLGVLSLIIWSLILVISFKYLLVVLSADNRGEGGNLALLAMILPSIPSDSKKLKKFAIFLGLLGASLIYGDGLITPAISVLSAVEGLEIATPGLKDYVVPITVFIITLIFAVQSRGTASIGKVFGPIMLLWFSTLGILGALNITKNLTVLSSFNPQYGINLLIQDSHQALVVLSSVFLAITGAEALYADMGHFGKSPIKYGWYTLVFPGLALNYLGQGAVLLNNPEAKINPFYFLVPEQFIYPLVALATMATVIASQALISGAFSITSQAIQLGYLPRMEVKYTSKSEIGQIYIPRINLLLFLGTVFLVLQFKSSSNLAAAYGLSVSTTMLITTIQILFVMLFIWKWKKSKIIPFIIIFAILDLGFLSANMLKLKEGGWIPAVIAAAIYIVMSTWNRGREIMGDKLSKQSLSFDDFMKQVKSDQIIKVPGVAIFMTRNETKTPHPLHHNVRHNRVIHQKTILLMVKTVEFPIVEEEDRFEIVNLDDGFFRVTIKYGFSQSPNVPEELKKLSKLIGEDFEKITFFLGRETILPGGQGGMGLWREKLFAFLSTNSQRATSFYHIPSSQVIEIGFQLNI